MKLSCTSIFFSLVYLTFFCFCPVSGFAQNSCCNILTNGDFEQGDTSFTSNLPQNCACLANSYCVGSNFQDKCQGWHNFTGNGGSGQFLIIDGSPSSAVDVWQNTVVTSSEGEYCFSFWIASQYGSAFDVGFTINGTLQGGPYTISQPTPVWTEYSGTVFLPPGTHNIAIRQLSGGGERDFGIDDISFGTSLNADFIVDLSATCGAHLQFNNISSGPAPLTYSWDFGDPASGSNNSSSLQHPNHLFTGCGEFEVCLIVTNGTCIDTSCQIALVDDFVPPVVICPPFIILDCDDDLNPGITGFATVTDNCDPNPGLTYTDASFGNLPCGGEIIRTWVATDFCSNESTCVQTISFNDNVPPLIVCPPSVAVACSNSVNPAITGIATATDNCDPDPTITFADVTSGTMPCDATIARTWAAVDTCHNSDICVQTIFVRDTVPPVITCPQNVIETAFLPHCVRGVYDIHPIFSDNCTFPSLSYTIIGATIVSGLGSANGTVFNVGISTVTYTVMDFCGNTSTCAFTVTIVCSNEEYCGCPSEGPQGTNLVVNGDFSAGNTGFTSDYIYTSVPAPSPGLYSVGHSHHLQSVSAWSGVDHTTAAPTGLFLTVDASLTPGLAAWRQQFTITEGVDYLFCAYADNLFVPNNNVAVPLVEVWLIDANNFTTLITSASLPEIPNVWVKLSATWTAPTTVANPYKLEIRAGTTLQHGNDFAVDDISFRACSEPLPCEASICPNNLILNPGFSEGAVLGPLGFQGHSDHWFSNVVTSEVSQDYSCCDPLLLSTIVSIPCTNGLIFPGYTGNIYQQGLSLLAGHQYKISFCAKMGLPDNTYFKFTATNSPVSGVYFDPFNCTNCQNIGVSPQLNSTWQNYTLLIFTPTQDWDVLFIHGFSQELGSGLIDNICVEEVFYSCCADEQAFIENTNNGLNTHADQITREGVFEAGNLMECNKIDYIDWGDGSAIINGPIMGNTILRHTYEDAGTYQIEYRVREFDPQDSSQLACLSHVFLDSIIILPDTCYCKDPGFTDLILHWDNGTGQSIQCQTSYELIPCPQPGTGYFFTGKFECEGDSCELTPHVSWDLQDPSGNYFYGSSIASPYFVINLLPGQTSQNGIYTMSITSFCGADTCKCEFQFVVDCGTACPCGPEDIHALSLAVNQGFATIASSTGCTVCFAPLALSDCETIEWHLDNPNGILLGSSIGNQTFCHTFQGPGSYAVVMVVTRLKPDGTLCELFVKSKTIRVTCVVNPACDVSILKNSSFNEGAIPGGFNSGGASVGWTSINSELEVIEGQSGSHDDWTIKLYGNLDKAGVLTSQDPICISRDTGALALRVMTDPIPGIPGSLDPPVGRGKPSKLSIQVYLGNTLEIRNCEDENCVQLAVISMEEFVPGEWYDITIPYNFSDWNPNESCGAGLLIRPAIYVTNDINTSQGGEETYSYGQIDNFCFTGTLITSTIDPGKNKSLRIYPNPNSGIFTVELPEAASAGMHLSIIDLTGQVLFEKVAEVGSIQQTMEIDKVPPGLYFLQVQYKDRMIIVDKVVKH